MLINNLNIIITDSRKAICNKTYDRTITLYSSYIKDRYKDYLYEENIDMGSLLEEEELVERFIEQILVDENRKEQRGINPGLLSLITFYKYLNKRNIITEESLSTLIKCISKYRVRVKILKREDKYLHINDIHEIIKKCNFWFSHAQKYRPDKNDRLRFKTVVYFVYFTGIRRVELEILKRSDFNLEECSVKIAGRICYYPFKIKEMLINYFNSEEEVGSAFNFTNAVAGKFNKILSRYKFRGQRITLSFLRDSNANMIVSRTKNVGVLMKLHGEVSKSYIKKYELKDKEVAKIYKARVHYQERS